MFTLHHRNQLKQHQIEKHLCFTTVLDLQTLLYAQTSILYKVHVQGKVEIIPVIFGYSGTVEIKETITIPVKQFISKDFPGLFFILTLANTFVMLFR